MLCHNLIRVGLIALFNNAKLPLILNAPRFSQGLQGVFAKLVRPLVQVSMGIESSLVQLLETGVMHSDPHPGNLLLQADGKLV